MKILEELKNFKCGNEDFERGFNAAINIIAALNTQHDEEIDKLKSDIAKLQLKVAALECDKKPYRWYPYRDVITSGIIYKNTTVTCDKKSK